MSEGCSICTSGKAPVVNQLKNSGMPTDKIAKEAGLGFSRSAIRYHFKNCDTPPFDSSVVSIEDVSRPLNSDAEVLAVLGMSSDSYQIVGGTNVSARTLASGDMLYSYRAKVQKVEPLEEHTSFDTAGWRERLLRDGSAPSLKRKTDGVAAALIVADQQIGKKHTEQSLDNWVRAVNGFVKDTKDKISTGTNIDRLFVGFGGDICEGIANSYTNQVHTVEMNLSTQIEVGYDTSVWMLKYLTDELGLPITGSWVISNHGETWVRNGGKDPITTRADNIDTHIGRLVRSTFEKIPGYDGIEWNIADGNPANVFTVNGVKIYQTHNYVEKGSGTGVEAKTVGAMQKQILGRPMELGDVKLFLTSHYHHFWMTQDRNYTVFGTPALEAKLSSEWLFEMSGVWSEPGALGFIIDKDEPMGWNSLRIF